MSDEMSRNPSSAATGSGTPSRELSDTIADWLALYAGNFGKEPSEETILAYKIGFSGLEPKYLHKAFAACLLECKFWPTVAEIREAYYKIMADQGAKYYLAEVAPEWTEEDRKKWARDMDLMKQKIDEIGKAKSF